MILIDVGAPLSFDRIKPNFLASDNSASTDYLLPNVPPKQPVITQLGCIFLSTKGLMINNISGRWEWLHLPNIYLSHKFWLLCKCTIANCFLLLAILSSYDLALWNAVSYWDFILHVSHRLCAPSMYNSIFFKLLINVFIIYNIFD